MCEVHFCKDKKQSYCSDIARQFIPDKWIKHLFLNISQEFIISKQNKSLKQNYLCYMKYIFFCKVMCPEMESICQPFLIQKKNFIVQDAIFVWFIIQKNTICVPCRVVWEYIPLHTRCFIKVFSIHIKQKLQANCTRFVDSVLPYFETSG